MSSFNRGRGRGRGRGSYRNDFRPQMPEKKTEEVVVKEDVSSHHSSDEAFVHSTTIVIDLELDGHSEAWFRNLKNSWNKLKKCTAITNMIHQHFEICVNPYEQALRLMYNSLDFKYAKPKSLSYLVMEEFKVWSNSARNKINHLLTIPLKITAFNIVRQQNMFCLMKLVAEVYEVADNCDIFLGIIKHMVKQKQYKEAAQCATLLNLHDHFDINDFLVPLILQDKLTCAEDFMSDSQHHQMELVAFLDSMLGQPVSIRSALDPYIINYKIPEVKYDKLHYKPWRKLVTRLVKMYNLPEDVTPFLNKRRNEGALQFLMYKRFVDHSFGEESWREMVQEAVKDDPRLQLEVVVQVNMYGDVEEALRWAHFYGIPQEDWPYTVRMYYENPDQNRHQQTTVQEETWDVDNPQVEYYKFKLPESSVHLVDTEAAFEAFLDNGLRDVNIVGIDCEWKPTFGVHSNELALMQIATRKEVYVLDTIVLGSKVPHLWQELSQFLFNNCDILKLGFSFVNDTSMIKQSLPHLSFNQKQEGILDLLSLWKHIEKLPRVVLPFEVPNAGPSLGTLVQKCFGCTLDKSDQFSNWEKRPLRQSQISYAALDAYCLIEVFDVMNRCCEDAGISFEEVLCSVMANPGQAQKKKSKKNVRKHRSVEFAEQPPSPYSSPVSACEVKLVCDTMLQGLGKALRSCGIDTYILDNNDEHMECVRHYTNDGRYILTKGFVFNRLMGNVPPGHCLRLLSDDIDEQIKQVLNYYKIIVTKDDIFSVCQYCNGKSFIKVSSATMNALVNRSQVPSGNPPPDYYDDLEDEATGFSSDEDYFEDRAYTHRTLSAVKKSPTYNNEHVDVQNGTTRTGSKILVEGIPPNILLTVDSFYICELCGKVYWDGSHLQKVLDGRLRGIVDP